jgi:hypothetical protein
VKEEKKSYRDRASSNDLKLYLERIGEKREIIRNQDCCNNISLSPNPKGS